MTNQDQGSTPGADGKRGTMEEITAIKPKQIQWTVPLGNDAIGRKRLETWKKAAVKEMRDVKLFNAWIRQVMDAASAKVLKNKKN